jgi:hypothetical protein
MAKTVVVLGCGPAGLFAAQAALLSGCDVAIISEKRKSFIYGAQYLHEPIPGLMDEAVSFPISTIRYGVPERYAQRVYNDASMPTSWSKAAPSVVGYDLRAVYETAWDSFQDEIADMPVDSPTVDELASQFDLVISTVPAWAICGSGRHRFPSVPIMVNPDLQFQIGDFPAEHNFVIYNGTIEGLWYRASQINGFRSTEAVAHPALANGDWHLGFKIMDTDCDCHPNIVRTGRMGKWKRGVLTHHAFYDTLEAISDRFGDAWAGSD